MPLLTLHRTQTDPLLRKSPQQCPPRNSPPVLPLETVNQLQQSPSLVQSRRNTHFIDAARMASAKLKQHLHIHDGPHRLFRHNSTGYIQPPVDEEQRQKERDFIGCYDCNSAPLSHDEICDDSRNKEVGCASKNIRVGDFQLLKTIGTGKILQSSWVNLVSKPYEANARNQARSRGCGSRVSLTLQAKTRRFLH